MVALLHALQSDKEDKEKAAFTFYSMLSAYVTNSVICAGIPWLDRIHRLLI
jgi:hypothetical protein